MRMRMLTALTLTLALAVARAHAAVAVFAEDPATADIAATLDPATGEWTITINNTGVGPDANVHILSDSEDAIARITVRTDHQQLVRLFIGDENGMQAPSTIGVIERAADSAFLDVDLVIQKMTTTSDVGVIHVSSMGDFEISGSITGGIVLFDALQGGSGIFIAGLESNIIVGDVLGDINIPFGYMFRLTVQGRIGTPANPVNIRVGKHISDLRASEFNADIDTTSFGFAGTIGLLEGTRDFGGTGDFNGSLKTSGFAQIFGPAPEIRVAGKLAGRVNILESLDAPLTILADKGLTGQVIINGGDAQADWINAVTVGAVGSSEQVVLDPMNFTAGAYPDTPSELGGGSVGLAPFNQHMEGSSPFRGGVITDTASDTVRMRFYGPITIDTSQGVEPIEIERRATGSTGSWNGIMASAFTIAVYAADMELLLTQYGKQVK